MKKALIVGLNDYPNSKLEWCDNDAIAMKELIESNGDGIFHVPYSLFGLLYYCNN